MFLPQQRTGASASPVAEVIPMGLRWARRKAWAAYVVTDSSVIRLEWSALPTLGRRSRGVAPQAHCPQKGVGVPF